jgi:hypothetical protein
VSQEITSGATAAGQSVRDRAGKKALAAALELRFVSKAVDHGEPGRSTGHLARTSVHACSPNL